MQVTREDFLRWVAEFAEDLDLSSMQLDGLKRILISTGKPLVVWLRGASCTGCSSSLLNQPPLSTLTSNLVITSLDCDKTVYNEQFILCIEGGIPTAANGKCCIIGERDGAAWTMLSAVNELASKARYVIAVGSCAVYGTTVDPSGYTGIRSVQEVIGSKVINPVINLPDCPVYPDVVVGTIVTLLTGGLLELDHDGRPVAYYEHDSKEEFFCLKTALGQASR